MQPVIQFEDAVLLDVNYPDTKRLLKAVVLIDAALNPENAAMIKSGHMFKRNGDPIDSPGTYAPPIRLGDVELELPSGAVDGQMDVYRPQIIWSFRIKPRDDLNLRVQFRAHITGHDAYNLLPTREKFLGKKLTLCRIKSLQQAFNYAQEKPTDDDDEEDENEEAPPLVAAAAAAPCLLCDRGVPRNEDGKHILADGLGDCPRPLEGSTAPNQGRAVACRTAMGVKKPKMQRRRNPLPTEKEIADSVSVQ